ncbi:MAG: DUF1998 domain-containing protein [Gloeocapsa sp. DLM2.Bin57]|nr:MAG: DUF1998 domain-containing protein [Gloeocapsa sp. DLM2.Bin57]
MEDKYKIGELRPSQILFTYGIGAIADLLNLSVIVLGLDEWNSVYMKEIKENRLLAKVCQELNQPIKKLSSPPQNDDDPEGKIGIPVAPFPSWMVCPKCRLLAPLESQLFQIKVDRYRTEQTRYVHQNCSKSQKKPPTVIPVRFLVACEKGHLDEFPWSYFVHRGNNNCSGTLRLEEYGVSGSTTDIMVKCDQCQEGRLLSEAFGESGKRSLPRCRGRHPHLRHFDESCDQQMRAMLLGASNSWFSVTLSALSLPEGNGEIEELVNKNWSKLQKATTPELLEMILEIADIHALKTYPLEDVYQVIQAKFNQEKIPEIKDLKTPEWEAFSSADISNNTSEFQLRPVDPPTGFIDYFEKTVLVEKLKEVRALIGFTRLISPGDFVDIQEKIDLAPLSRKPLEYVPATEIRGEGIFLELAKNKLKQWEEVVKGKESKVREAQKDWLNSRGIDPEKVPFPGMRYLLIHSLAHALMRQLAIACGYNAASLRERIYSALPKSENGSQAGLLIYTATPDSEGTLGGLVNLGEPDTLGYHLRSALEAMKLCASDPLCAEHTPSSANLSLHWAACHACLFSPETSCERGNKFLDRSLLVPTVSNSDLAFFV